jgi:hypothetical protein
MLCPTVPLKHAIEHARSYFLPELHVHPGLPMWTDGKCALKKEFDKLRKREMSWAKYVEPSFALVTAVLCNQCFVCLGFWQLSELFTCFFCRSN